MKQFWIYFSRKGSGKDASQLKTSKTKENLMKAFAGESQARNRYTFAAEEAGKEGLYAVSQIFLFTAEQERLMQNDFMNY